MDRPEAIRYSRRHFLVRAAAAVGGVSAVSGLLQACSSPAPAAPPTAPAKPAEPAKPTEAAKSAAPAGGQQAAPTPPAAQSAPTAATGKLPVPSGTGQATVALSSTIITFDPANYRHRNTETALRNIFDGLLTRRPDAQMVPEIAESYKQTSPTDWEFKIRKGIKFHDGSDLTVDDVKFTYDRILTEGAIDGKTAPRKGLLPPIKSVDKVDENTIKFVLEKPTPGPMFLSGLVHNQIIPKAYTMKVGDAEFAKKPIGAGPFKFVEGKIDELLVMERFDDYYGGSPDLPPVQVAPLKRVIFRFVPEVATRVAALKAGEIDIIQGVPPDLLADLRADSNVEVKSFDGTNVIHFALNVQKAPFDKKEMRQAINMAVNWKPIIDRVLMGEAKRLTGVTPPFSAHFNANVKPYDHNPDEAKKLIAAAGGNGAQFVIDTNEQWKNLSEAITEQLRAVGLQPQVRVWGDFAALQAEALKGERQMVVQEWGNALRHPIDHMHAILKADGRANYAQYKSDAAEELMTQGLTEVNETKADEIYARAQEIIHEDAPLLFGFVPNELEAGSTKLKNWVPGPDGRELMGDVDKA